MQKRKKLSVDENDIVTGCATTSLYTYIIQFSDTLDSLYIYFCTINFQQNIIDLPWGNVGMKSRTERQIYLEVCPGMYLLFRLPSVCKTAFTAPGILCVGGTFAESFHILTGRRWINKERDHKWESERSERDWVRNKSSSLLHSSQCLAQKDAWRILCVSLDHVLHTAQHVFGIKHALWIQRLLVHYGSVLYYTLLFHWIW